jgi:hypothetical protein
LAFLFSDATMNSSTGFIIPDWIMALVILFKLSVSLWEWRSKHKDYLIGFLCVPLAWLLLYYLLPYFLLQPMTLSESQAIFRPGFALLLVMNTLILVNGEVNCRIKGFLDWLRRTRSAAADRIGGLLAGLRSWTRRLMS